MIDALQAINVILILGVTMLVAWLIAPYIARVFARTPSSTKNVCATGASSIWSLSRETPARRCNRSLTIEVTRDGRIVQCRGFANRLPYANEVTMVKRWAQANGLTWKALER